MKMKPENLSVLGLYGNRPMFQQKTKEGFATIAFGEGPWRIIDGEEKRIVRFFVLFHPDGRVSTWQHPKVRPLNISISLSPFQVDFVSRAKFQDYIDEWGLMHGAEQSMSELLKQLGCVVFILTYSVSKRP